MIRVLSQYGRAGATFKLTSTNDVQILDSDKLVDGGRRLCAIMIQTAVYDAKIAFGADPMQGAANLGHIVAKDQAPLFLVGETLLSDFRYISALDGEHSTITITPFYQG